MEQTLVSEGRCIFCNEIHTQKRILKHLAGHLEEKEKLDANMLTSEYCHIEVDAGEMFLHLLVKGTGKMKIIDDFLRRIWLDCCGHLSAFMDKNEEIEMSETVNSVLQPKVKIFHDYDFGSTTRILLKGIKYYKLNEKANIILLSRNEPLNLMCATCEIEPAIYLCTTCAWEEYSFFCKKCSKKHEKKCDDFADYSRMPVVNSPRMGVCGYEGGRIDKERDGNYKLKK